MLDWLPSGRPLRRTSLALCLTALVPVQAQASEIMSAPMALVAAFGTVCGGPMPSAAGYAPAASASKASSLLGGAPSALEQIKLQQEGSASDQFASAATSMPPAVELQAQPVLAPAAAPPSETAACLRWLQPQLAIPAAPATSFAPAAGDILASKRLAIRHTMFDADWTRVKDERISRSRYARMVGPVPAAPAATLERVNAWVNHNVAYVEDRDLFGKADFWAGASRTLKLRKGDCEDIALTKMQLLAAAGFAREDMVLTIARDLVRGADHAILMVKQDGRYVMLDNATDTVLDASAANDYRPVLSFGQNQAWLHGYQTAALTVQ